MEEQAKQAIEVLGELLEPLGAKRKALILKWVRREIQTHALVQYVYEKGPPVMKDDDGKETGGPQIWQLGEASPINPDERIFAMFYLPEDGRTVNVYTFMPIELDGKEACLFFRSVIFEPIHIHGPVHHNALLPEFGIYLAEDEELDALEEGRDIDEPMQANGVA